jgi:hypothetical protein
MRLESLVIATVLFSVAQGWTQATKVAGTQQVFDVTQAQAVTAISNAFAQWHYKRMDLESAKYDGSVPGWHGTNGWILFPLDGPITVTPWRNSKELVPYIPTFHITVQALGTNRTIIAVRTIDARVIHGKEIGVHGGWAHHEVNVPPVLSEETNVLMAISNVLLTANSRRTNIAPSVTITRPTKPPAVPGTEQAAFEEAVKAAQAARAKPAGTNQ